MRLEDGVALRVDDFVNYIVWRAERGHPLGTPFGATTYIAVTPPFSDGSKIRILFDIDTKRCRVDLHSPSLASASAA